MPTFRHGKGSYFQLGNSSNALQDISNVLTDVSFPRSVDNGEVTAFGASAKSYIVGLQDAKISLSASYDATIDAQIKSVIDALDSGTLASGVNWVYGPEGSASSRIKYSGAALITSYEVSAGVGDVVQAKIELQVTGAVTRATF
jgi:hypothetical protein